MRYFLDTEFIEAPNHLDLISIGIVSEDGRACYYENSEVDWSKASQWVLDNVKPHLNGTVHQVASKAKIARFVRQFVSDATPPEFWGYYADYDWVALCWLYGTMMDLPDGWPMYCRDLKQWADMLGNPALPEQGKGEHHALADATWNRDAYAFLAALAERGPPHPNGNNQQNSHQEWADGLYAFLLREFADPDQSSGHTVTAEVRPHFNALCVFIAQRDAARAAGIAKPTDEESR